MHEYHGLHSPKWEFHYPKYGCGYDTGSPGVLNRKKGKTQGGKGLQRVWKRQKWIKRKRKDGNGANRYGRDGNAANGFKRKGKMDKGLDGGF